MHLNILMKTYKEIHRHTNTNIKIEIQINQWELGLKFRFQVVHFNMLLAFAKFLYGSNTIKKLWRK